MADVWLKLKPFIQKCHQSQIMQSFDTLVLLILILSEVPILLEYNIFMLFIAYAIIHLKTLDGSFCCVHEKQL